MERLTEADKNGNWWLKGLNWNEIRVGHELWPDAAEKLYRALFKLYSYEETEKSPEEILGFEEVAQKMVERVVAVSKQLSEERKRRQWILPEDALPDDNDSVLVTVSGHFGGMSFEDALALATYDGESGWIIDGYPEFEEPDVKAWMQLPEAYESGKTSVPETEPEWKTRMMKTFLGSRRG